MERKDKENFSFTFELAYTQVIKHTPYPYLNFILLVITYILTLAKFYDLVSSTLPRSTPYCKIKQNQFSPFS